jgi:hypothetical protein
MATPALNSISESNRDQPLRRGQSSKAGPWTWAASLLLLLSVLVAGGVWLCSTPSLATCATVDGHRLRLVAITERGLSQSNVPGPRWRRLAVSVLPVETATRLGLAGPLMSSTAPLPRHYWIEVPRGAGYQVAATGPGGDQYVTLDTLHLTWTEGEYMVVAFSGDGARQLRFFRPRPDGTEENLGIMQVR